MQQHDCTKSDANHVKISNQPRNTKNSKTKPNEIEKFIEMSFVLHSRDARADNVYPLIWSVFNSTRIAMSVHIIIIIINKIVIYACIRS